jgi:hypothetical protein
MQDRSLVHFLILNDRFPRFGRQNPVQRKLKRIIADLSYST